ncbi:hypothetical protein DFQ26_006377 [Actinomortierella ambigua]|nr:hypothetical protein DFQ26_006377 [Actinomortierella ambigua]
MARGYLELRDPPEHGSGNSGFSQQQQPPLLGHVRKGEEVELDDMYMTNPDLGLTSEQAHARLVRFGPNELVEKKPSKILKFLSYFYGPIAFLIQVACIISAIVGDWFNFGIILGLLFLNAIIGYIEESRAENAVESLRQTLALKSRCVRNGFLSEVDAATLVPGDIIVLRLGDIVPADAKLLGIDASGEITTVDLLVDQSALTGESLPARKGKGDEVFSSTIVKQGQQKAIIAKTGVHSVIGQTAHLIATTPDEGHFQKIIGRIGNFLILFTLVLVIIIIVFQYLTIVDPERRKVLNILGPVLILAVAAIPVGLPTVMAVTMAVGARGLAAKQVIVKRLAAVEEMSSLSILCSDKTGTLTLNELTFDEPYLSEGFSATDILLYSYLASEYGANDPIEMAVRAAAETEVPLLRHRPSANKVPGYHIEKFVPFNPVAKYTQAEVKDLNNNVSFLVAKGAPQVILRLVGGDDRAVQAYTVMAKRGLRAIGVARTVAGSDEKWMLVGLISLLDPPRPDSAETIQRCEAMGVTVKMVTGDQQLIAKEVARRLGMGQVILDASHLSHENRTPESILSERFERADGFAEVTPEHKFRIVDTLQKRGRLVGMTGDGVNDAPALKKANVGIAVHGCTDAARSAADIVLLAPGLSTIIEGILASRAIFQRMRSYALYRITSTVHFLMFFFVMELVYDWTLPAKLLIMICILNDLATLVIAVDNAQVSKRPDKWRVGQLIFLSCLLGALLTALSFAHFYYFSEVRGYKPYDDSEPLPPETDRRIDSIMYLHMSSAPHFVIFSTRLAGFFWESVPSLLFTTVIIGTQVIALFMVLFGWLTPAVPAGEALAVFAISFVSFMALDVVKVLVFRSWTRLSHSLACAPCGPRRRMLQQHRRKEVQQKRVWKNIGRIQRDIGLRTKVLLALRDGGDRIPQTMYDVAWDRHQQ